MKPPINVVVLGDTGVGKSSVINLIAKEDVACVGRYACTTQCTRYGISFDDMNFAIFDTVGFQDPWMMRDDALNAIEKAYELIVNLDATGGVHLLLFCIRGGRITMQMEACYRLFREGFCDTKVPIAFVVTHLEYEPVMEDWWQGNVGAMEHYGIKSNGHACITALRLPGIPEKYTESQKKIRELLKTCALQNEGFPEPLLWFARLGRGMRSCTGKYESPEKEDVIRVLTRRCKLNPVTAEMIVGMMEKNDPGDQDHETGYMLSAGKSRTTNVVLFGERGIGKNLVINLIAQKEIAQVSSDADDCTMQSTRYDISFDGMDFAIFDIVGLEEPQMGVNGYLTAIEKAYELSMELGAAGGIHLLLFCARRGGTTPITQSNYRLCRELLRGTKIPMALVFTGFEKEVEMEDWLARNKTHMEHYGIGQVCITTVQDDTYGGHLKYTESRNRIRELLKVFLSEQPSRFARLGRGMKDIIEKHGIPKIEEHKDRKRDVMHILTRRFGLDLETTRKITNTTEKGA